MSYCAEGVKPVKVKGLDMTFSITVYTSSVFLLYSKTKVVSGSSASKVNVICLA